MSPATLPLNHITEDLSICQVSPIAFRPAAPAFFFPAAPTWRTSTAVVAGIAIEPLQACPRQMAHHTLHFTA